ncbi:uncharacterized protein METZ01_LOCUS203410 [marine metagenome]|uniref:Uncharacterized protein n=1 Tax=marine metagenome TaxID=408172 RepID=A0A382EID5_9ZZZZ
MTTLYPDCKFGSILIEHASRINQKGASGEVPF